MRVSSITEPNILCQDSHRIPIISASHKHSSSLILKQNFADLMFGCREKKWDNSLTLKKIKQLRTMQCTSNNNVKDSLLDKEHCFSPNLFN